MFDGFMLLQHLDLDVAWFREKKLVSTTENLAIYCWERMRTVMPDPTLLYEVTIFETDKNSVTYRGE